ncbi:ecdysone oxidase isoform X2 [Amyelois transitella]|nr:ecdysone oxidase isoform X2 [Amyelois transitella]XP_013188236.1 ecdysone oxidase isoform X2 [Amyelois transitella]
MNVELSCPGGGAAVTSTFVSAVQFFAASQCLLSEPWPEQAAPVNESTFDYIVVGGGTAGAALAARLAAWPGATVLLVEAGGDPPQEAIVPGFRDVLKGSKYDWNFTTENDHSSSQALKGGRQRQPRGYMLGGSGSLNDMVYARGFPADFDEWAQTVGEDWAWGSVLEYFMKTEHLTDETIVNNPHLMKYHGRGGAIEVSGLNESTFDTDRFLDAFKELGFNIVDDMTNPETIGAGRFSHTIRNGQRDSSLTGLLNEVNGNLNLFILKNTLATKVLIENSTAYGVRVLSDNVDLQYYARKEVIISAGTFNTAKLLMLSGVGPKEHLDSLGIRVKSDLPVGTNLHDHVMVLTYLAAENGTCFTSPSTTYMDMIRYLYDRTGMFSYSNSMGAYVSLDGDPNVPDFAIYPVCVPMGNNFFQGCSSVLGFSDEICNQLHEKNKEYELLSLAVVLLKPKSRGEVRLRSVDPLDPPLIYSGTFNNDDDLAGFPQVMEIAYSLVNTSYFKRMNAHVVDLNISSCSELVGRERLRCSAKSMATSAWHAVGTAAMGAVVDSQLKVYGVSGLRAVDASVMPKVTRGNTNAPVVMIAEKAADFIRQDLESDIL